MQLVEAQDFQFEPVTRKAYDLTLDLQFAEARRIIPAAKTPQEIYVVALGEALELILTEDEMKLEVYEALFDKRKDRKSKKNPDELLLQTELSLQWAFVYLKFGMELDAAMQLRQAYLISKQLQEDFPSYKAVLKSAGLLNVMIGSVPEKYNWILSLLNMEGSVPAGLAQMQNLMNSSHQFSFETTLWYAFIQGFILQKPELAIVEVNELLKQQPDQTVANFLNISFHLKNSANEEALRLLNKLDDGEIVSKLPYIKYLKGEALLHKGDYEKAIASYRWFIDNYGGQNFLKDANYKSGLCFWLLGKENDAKKYFHEAKNIGKENMEADKNASRALLLSSMPPIPLIKIRYYTDGGYYQEAKKLLSEIKVDSLPDKKSTIEFYYRQARLAHKMKDIPNAKSNYKKTIELNVDSEWYFAPNACLQLGYIYLDEKNNTDAKKYFEKAMSYKRHEYKNSIDSKARSALSQLNGLK